MQIAERLKARRAERGLEQQQAAEELGIPLRTYQEWERAVPEAVARGVRLGAWLADTDTHTDEELSHG